MKFTNLQPSYPAIWSPSIEWSSDYTEVQRQDPSKKWYSTSRERWSIGCPQSNFIEKEGYLLVYDAINLHPKYMYEMLTSLKLGNVVDCNRPSFIVDPDLDEMNQVGDSGRN